MHTFELDLFGCRANFQDDSVNKTKKQGFFASTGKSSFEITLVAVSISRTMPRITRINVLRAEVNMPSMSHVQFSTVMVISKTFNLLP